MKAATTHAPEGGASSAEPRTSVTTSKPAAQPTLATRVNRALNALFSKVRNDTYIH